MSAQSHRSDPRTLSRRTLQRDHRHLAQALRPGLTVLDIGCGTGAITSGIAEAVGPKGKVVGVDRDPSLLEVAGKKHAALSNLQFVQGDVTALSFVREFDVVTAARTLQWVANPALAVSKMKQAAKPSGLLVILDYNHESNGWEPEPPAEFQQFYRAFLRWRDRNGWDNRIADHVPALFSAAGLSDIESHPQDEVVERGDLDFEERSQIWSEVIETLGEKIAAAGFCSETQMKQVRERYDTWVRAELTRQTLAMRAIVGVVP